MKVKFLSAVCFIFLLCGWSTSASGQSQEKGLSQTEVQDPSHLELILNEDKSIPGDNESKPKGPGKDSAASSTHFKPVLTPAPIEKTKLSEINKLQESGEDEDALSFNFLYYIIQKFKISDLIDE